MDNLEEMDKFLKTYNLPRPNHEEMENLSRSIKSKEIISVIRTFTMKKSLGSHGFTGKCYQPFKLKEELIST